MYLTSEITIYYLGPIRLLRVRIRSALACLSTKKMYIFPIHKLPSRRKSNAFTVLELLVVISLISLLASISVPSFLNYINLLKLKSFRSDAISDINYLVSASQKYGGNCNVQFNQLSTSTRPSDRFGASLKCFQDSSQLQINNSSARFIPLESNDIFILSNSASLQVGNHGAIVGSQDYLFVIGFQSSYGASSLPLCFTLARYNSSIKLGTYRGNVSSLAGSFLSRTIPSLNPLNCT